MPNEAIYALTGLGVYLLGAIPFGLVVVRIAKGKDLRELGSGNIGATNAGREFGAVFFVLVFLLDAAKGFVPVFFLAPWVAQVYPCSHCHALEHSLAALYGACGLGGHVFPLYLRFKGGKGVATGLGVSVALNPQAAAVSAGLFLLLFVLFRYVSLASIAAAIALPAAHLLTSPDPWLDRLPTTLFYFAAACLVVVRHRGNLARLRAGTEPRVGPSS